MPSFSANHQEIELLRHVETTTVCTVQLRGDRLIVQQPDGMRRLHGDQCIGLLREEERRRQSIELRHDGQAITAKRRQIDVGEQELEKVQK